MKTDYIELHVYDDGDIVLTKRPEPKVDKLPEEGVLCFGMDSLEELKAELHSYGCDPEVSHRVIMEVIDGGYGQETFVK